MSTAQIQGIPYVPGCAQGKLKKHIGSVTEQDILLLDSDGLASLTTHKPAGCIVVDGAPYSHNMIQQLGLGVPLVIISAQQAECLAEDSYLEINGSSGKINTTRPSKAMECKIPVIPSSGKAITSADGVKIYLNASISNTAAASRARDNGAAAIGLVRSEFIQPAHAQIPSSDFYQQAFTAMCEAANPLTITIRLLDLAPDKQPLWLPPLPYPPSPSGMQGVRLYQYKPIQQIVRAQLTAMDALTGRFDIRLLIPYVSLSGEFLYWRDIIRSLITAPVAVGAMLEIPAAVLEIDNWLTRADFVSIGCNDLMQNLFAADRDLAQLKPYLNPYSPALLRFLQQTALRAGKGIDKIQLCGLLAQWPGILPLLAGMGYSSYSVEPLKIPYLAQTIRVSEVTQMQPVMEQVCNASNARQVCEILKVPVWPEE